MRISDWISDVCSSDLRTLDEYLATFFGQIAAGFEQSGRVRPRRVGHAARRFQSPRRGLVSDQPDPHATRAHLRPAIVHVACGSAEKADRKSTRLNSSH